MDQSNATTQPISFDRDQPNPASGHFGMSTPLCMVPNPQGMIGMSPNMFYPAQHQDDAAVEMFMPHGPHTYKRSCIDSEGTVAMYNGDPNMFGSFKQSNMGIYNISGQVTHLSQMLTALVERADRVDNSVAALEQKHDAQLQLLLKRITELELQEKETEEETVKEKGKGGTARKYTQHLQTMYTIIGTHSCTEFMKIGKGPCHVHKHVTLLSHSLKIKASQGHTTESLASISTTFQKQPPKFHSNMLPQPFLITASKVTSLTFACKVLKLPASHVFSWNGHTDNNNPVGS
ncbi:uncharacterized protein LACBIDRAFT_324398 [Laccaria bicolor S238N-H82]|uniref:Predicted protein n=1 Tax=Laccaria bicolor (strain S238N-H82 / ATCC MYA-4686) TaxID=486041 RepID=B0D1Q0_LACBS|nr:uncharacterized protein LACBIDRAFT_324398 [Laccaria bicolor S238N-H82]EDR12030.1 predicted protein [Laccaria bicolor S238N-H82]|eukprot:XP_001877927.1 predicted protein [Laccaria bicolor S238N-H82]